MQVPSNRIGDILPYYIEYLKPVFSKLEAKFHVYWLIEHFVGIPSAQMALHFDDRLNESDLLKVHFAVKDLLANKPIQHIVGKVEFADVELMVNEHVLIPRPETEELISLIARDEFKAQSALDVGTGSGAIAVSLSKALGIPLTAIEKDKMALQVALENAQQNRSHVAFIRMDFLDRKVWESLDFKVDLLVSNPPYVREQEKDLMSDRVLKYEPHLALFVEDDNPLIFYKALAEFALQKLSPGGHVWLEINEYLAEETATLFRPHFACVEIIKDFRDKDRFVHAAGFGQ